MEQIVLATGNKGKIREFSEAFSHLSIDCVPVKDVISIEEPEETGTTFMENALLKAHYYAKATNRPCLADDSGITVDALNGAPGVYSARYAGHHGDDQANNEKLIHELQGKSDRTGHYVCALALVYPDGREVTVKSIAMASYKTSQKGTMALATIHTSMYLNLKRLWLNLALKKRKQSVIVVVHCAN